MFTGLVSDIGVIQRVHTTAAGREFVMRTAYSGVTEAESIACDGVCLTVRECTADTFTVAAVVTTLGRTTLGEWDAGRRVNLERAMAMGDRLGGHFVSGHVDTAGVITHVAREGDALLMDIALAEEWMPLMVQHGSITVNGVSLTINKRLAEGAQISLIEYTLRHTALGDLAVGSRVNVEADMVGKYVQQLALAHLPSTVNRLPS